MKTWTFAASLVVIAGCKKGGGESAKPFVDATGDVASTASLAATQLEDMPTLDGLDGFPVALKTLIELRGLAVAQKKVTPGGAVADCAERWYASTDAYVAAMTPIVEQAAKGDGSLSSVFELKAAYDQAGVNKVLCDLVADANACLSPLAKAKADTSGFLLLAKGHTTLCP